MMAKERELLSNHRAGTSSRRSRKAAAHTMEISGAGVDSMSGEGYGTPLKQCMDLVSLLAGRGLRFSISVKIEDSFVFQLKSEDAAEAVKVNKRSPSYKRRQERRKNLKKMTDTVRKEPANTRDEGTSTKEDVPGSFDISGAESLASLNLCPKPVYPRKSEGSVDSEMGYDANQQGASEDTPTEKSLGDQCAHGVYGLCLQCSVAEYKAGLEEVDRLFRLEDQKKKKGAQGSPVTPRRRK